MTIKLKDHFEQFFSRAKGRQARLFLLAELKKHNRLKIDVNDIVMTPSFADECFGLLAKEIGKDHFESQIEIDGGSSTTKSLVKLVVTDRLKQTEI